MAAENLVMTQVTMSGLVVALINWAKNSPKMGWVTKEKVTMLRVLSGIGAALASVGIAWVWDPTAHSLTVTGLSLATIGAMGYAALKSFVMQEIIYQSTRKPINSFPPKQGAGQTYTPKKP